MNRLNLKRADRIVRQALREDIGTGDVTSKAVVGARLAVSAVIIAHSKGVIAGLPAAARAFALTDKNVNFKPAVPEGGRAKPGRRIAFIKGNARSILAAERVALNFLSRLSGIATLTDEMAEAVKGAGVRLYDTRKTTPLHRYLEKYAVRVGGGRNHRQGLWDMVLIKDNHLAAFGIEAKTRDKEDIIKGAIRRARASERKRMKIEVEVKDLEECGYALAEKPDVVMLDNMKPLDVKKAVEMRKKLGLEGKVLLEVSGGITAENIKRYAIRGVDMISSGSLTLSASPLDFSLEMVFKNG